MTIALRSWRRALVLVAAVGMLVVVSSAQAQEGTGAEANKDCPGVAAVPGQTVVCNFSVQNTGDTPAEITLLTETSPDPGGAPVDISCVAGGITYDEGDTIPNGVVCNGTFTLVVPNDPALCGTAIRDRVDVALQYNQFDPPLTAGAFATHTTAIVCPADISVTKTADALSKVGDDVSYTITVTNNGAGVATKVSVIDTLLGDISGLFPATLAPGASATATIARTVAAGDPDPLLNTVTAIYSSGLTRTRRRRRPRRTCSSRPSRSSRRGTWRRQQVGDMVNYTITATNTSSADSPNCVGNVVDTLLGINQAVDLAPGASRCNQRIADSGGW